MTKTREYTRVYNYILQSDKLTSSEMRVFLALRSFASDDTLQAFPTLQTLSRATGIAVRHIRTYLRRLEAIGAIKTEFRKSNKGDFTSSLYTLNESPDFWNAKTEEEETAAAAAFNEDLMIKALEARGYVVTKPETETAATTEGEEKELEETAIPTKAAIESSSKKFNNSTVNNNTTRPPKSQQPKYNKDELREKFLIDWCLHHYSDNAAVQSWLNIIFDIICEILNDKREYQSNKETILQLSYSELIYLCERYEEQTRRQEIRNPRGYITSCLRNVKTDCAAYYTSKASHDLHNRTQ